jgi:hypothetical protein
MCRSIPVFFVQDDHDYYDNDEASDEMITFPPSETMLRLARATQKLLYPEFLPDPNRPQGLPGTREDEGRADISSNYGTLRYGSCSKSYSMTTGDRERCTAPPPFSSIWRSRLGSRHG